MRVFSGVELDIGQNFIAYTLGEYNSNGAYGHIWSCQITYNDSIVHMRSKNYLDMQDTYSFLHEEGLVVVPTIRPYMSIALNQAYLFYSNWIDNGSKRGGKLSVKTVDKYIRTLAQIPQDGQYFSLRNRGGEYEQYQLIEYRGDCEAPYVGDRKRIPREEPLIEYKDNKGKIHRDYIIDIIDRELTYIGGEPTHRINPGESFVEVVRDDFGRIIRLAYPCYFPLEWRRGLIDDREQEYLECIQWEGRYGNCRHLCKFDRPITLEQLNKGFSEGRYIKVKAAFAGKHTWLGFEEFLIRELNSMECGVEVVG